MQKINLYSLRQPAIIVKAETGLIYTNQTNGVACSHPSQEGFLVMLPPPGEKVRVFDPGFWYNTMPALDDALYDEIEEVLNRGFLWHLHDIRVNREASNYEAWVQVRCRGDFEMGRFFAGSFTRDPNVDPRPEDYPEYEGVLTWENCD